MNKKAFTISFRYHWQGSICEARKTFWLSRRPSLSRVISLADNLLGKGVGCAFSVVSGVHDWDGLIDEASWRVLPIDYGNACDRGCCDAK